MRVFDSASGPKSNGAWCNRSPFDISIGAATTNIEVWNSITLLVRNLSYIQLRVTIIRADRLLLQLLSSVCTGLSLGENLREFPLTSLYEVAGDGHIDRSVTVFTLFAPNVGLHF